MATTALLLVGGDGEVAEEPPQAVIAPMIVKRTSAHIRRCEAMACRGHVLQHAHVTGQAKMSVTPTDLRMAVGHPFYARVSVGRARRVHQVTAAWPRSGRLLPR